jgi:hypothetical protein
METFMECQRNLGRPEGSADTQEDCVVVGSEKRQKIDLDDAAVVAEETNRASDCLGSTKGAVGAEAQSLSCASCPLDNAPMSCAITQANQHIMIQLGNDFFKYQDLGMKA